MLNWVGVVGYQYEFLHTGALRVLLQDEDLGATIARRLSGRHDVVAVREPRTQAYVGGLSRSRADLVATLDLEDGSESRLAVETKVDSNATRNQMERTAGDSNSAVLLAVGLTSLQLSDLHPGAFGEQTERWTVTDLGGWRKMLDECGRLGPPLADYVSRVEQEHQDHVAAREVARSGGCAPADSWRNGDALLGWAWLAEIADAVADKGKGCFWCQSQKNGQVMYWHESRAPINDGGFIYLDFIVERERRQLIVKADGVVGEDRLAVWQACTSALGGVTKASQRRPTTAGRRSFRIAAVEFDGMTTDEVLRRAVDLRQRVCEFASRTT